MAKYHLYFFLDNNSSATTRSTMYVRFPLSLRNVEDLLFERGIDLCHETVRSGGTGSGRCSRVRRGARGSRACVVSGSGGGTWMRRTSGGPDVIGGVNFLGRRLCVRIERSLGVGRRPSEGG
jgi:hypothetical protein